jgi:hypothetical protein
MEKIEKDEIREERLYMEIIVDAYGEEERAMGWYYYLDDKIVFPFKARVIKNMEISPLQKDEMVTALGMVNVENCYNSMYVKIEWNKRKFGVPLEQLYPVDTTGEFNEDTEEAIADWHYWTERGYCF